VYGRNTQNRFGRNRAGADGKRLPKPRLDGHSFDSDDELRRYAFLKQLVDVGEIGDLMVKPKFPLVVNGQKITPAAFRPDFAYIEGAGRIAVRSPLAPGPDAYTVDGPGQLVVEDFKGHIDRKDPRWVVFAMKCRMVRALYGIEIRVITKKGPVSISY